MSPSLASPARIGPLEAIRRIEREPRLDSRISLQKLEIFCLVVELGSVSQAAEQLMLAQPGVSSHLKQLGERVGGELFERQGRGLRLTRAGEAAHGWARDVLMRTHELSRELAEIGKGELGRVMLSTSMTVGSYVLPPVLTSFADEHPDVQISLRVADLTAALRDVETGAADLGIVVSRLAAVSAALTAEAVGAERLVLVKAPQDHQVGGRTTMRDLESLRFVCAPAGASGRHLIESFLEDRGVRRNNVVLELGHPEAIKHATKAARGVALMLHSSVAAEIRDGSLEPVAVEGVELELPILLVYRSGRGLLPTHQRFADALRSNLALHS